MNQDLLLLDAVGQAELVARGEVSARELVDAAIARIEALDPEVHALASTDFEGARRRADARPGGPLGGVPFLVKDLLPVEGQPLTLGSRLFRSYVAPTGSPYSEALAASGLVTLGRTTTSELGLLGSTESLLLGVTRNPWNPSLSATGSSGGAAAAVASGMVPLAHASDGGGSIRIPASACGLFGFKPGRRRCLSTNQPVLFDMVVEHCVSRSVRDSALLLSLTEDPTGAVGPKVGWVREPAARRLRIGVYSTTLLGREPTPEVRRALDATAALCRQLGHDVRETPAPKVDGRAVSDAFFTIAGASIAGLAQMVEPMLGRAVGPDDLEPFTLSLRERFLSLPGDALPRALGAMEQASRDGEAFLRGFDVVLCPTMPDPPPELGTLAPTLDRELLIQRTESLAGYTPLYSICGAPAMSVPLHTTPDGVPIGSHFAAALGQEATLLALAYELEAAAPWAGRWPEITRAALAVSPSLRGGTRS